MTSPRLFRALSPSTISPVQRLAPLKLLLQELWPAEALNLQVRLNQHSGYEALQIVGQPYEAHLSRKFRSLKHIPMEQVEVVYGDVRSFANLLYVMQAFAKDF
jgi:hypothetical protein